MAIPAALLITILAIRFVDKKRMVALSLVAMLVPLCVVGAWMFRNYKALDSPVISTWAMGILGWTNWRSK